jgi:hypothetical protein
MTLPASSSALPDYYADERRARRRVRVRHALGWVGLLAGVAALAGVLRLWDAGR